MFWLWRSLNADDFREENTEFGGGWIYGGQEHGWYRDANYPTQEAKDSYTGKWTAVGLLTVADAALFAGGLTAVGAVASFVTFIVGCDAELDKANSTRREAELQRDLDRRLASSFWERELEHDFARRFNNITPGLGPQGSGLYQLLKAWLADCDKHHDCKDRKPYFSPRRLIDTKFGGSSTDRLVLVERQHCSDYIVLSHRWGQLTADEEARFCTNSSNIDQRLQGFNLADLPQTFQDAVTVTRGLGKRYLWIDSLCLIQPMKSARGTGGDVRSTTDVAEGLKSMGKIFASAYCTIAASSGTGSKQHFLSPRQGPNVSGAAEDFEQDVNQGPLNQRAWVLQERVLSRRTIHFTSNHVYWECGQFVRCDNFVKLSSAPGNNYFVQDPHFPERLHQAGLPRVVSFLEWLFNGYSKRGITVAHDRYNAISGLMTHMDSINVFGQGARYGAFEFCLGRLLLWRRAGDSSRPRIDYTAIAEPVPSWSWMAYPGEVQFMVGASEKLKVAATTDLYFNGCFVRDDRRLRVNVRRLRDCGFRAHNSGLDHTVYEQGSGEDIGTFCADQRLYTNFEGCVVVGYDMGAALRSNPMVYVIFVQKGKAGRNFTRVGVGKVKAKSIYGHGMNGILE